MTCSYPRESTLTTLDAVGLPSQCWVWEGDWHLVLADAAGQADCDPVWLGVFSSEKKRGTLKTKTTHPTQHGWQYALGFQLSSVFQKASSLLTVVRRRRWRRMRRQRSVWTVR